MSDDDFIPFVPTSPEPKRGASGEDFVPFKETPQIGLPEAIGRGVRSGFLLNQVPQVAALAEASGMVPELKYPEGGTRPSYGPIEALVGAGRLGLEKLAPDTFGGGAGQRYEERLASEKARQAASREQYPGTSMASEVGGSILNPISKIIPVPEAGKTFLQNAMRAAPPSAALGAIQGSGEGETWSEKGMNALKGLIGGGVAGGAVSGALGKVMPGARAPSGEPSPADIVGAAERLSSRGAPLQVPKIVASNDELLSTLGSTAKELPFVGKPLTEAAERTAGQIGSKVSELSGNQTRLSAGETAKDALTNWIGPRSQKLVSDAYDKVDNLITTPALQPLDATRKVAQSVQDEMNKSQKVLGEDPAVKFLMNAITDPAGLDYQGLKGLRTRIGQMLDDPSEIYKDASPSLRKLYAGLTEDLKAVVEKSGGPRALKEFEAANAFNKEIQSQREALLKITGTKESSKSGDQIFDTLLRQAGSSGATDIPKLALAQKSMTPQEWAQVSRGVIDNLSINKTTNAFDPASLFRQYGKLSDQGKDILFGPAKAPSYGVRHALDDLATVGKRLDRLNAIASNQGGGERKILTAAELFGLVFHPLKAIPAVVAGRAFSSVMAEPATAQSVARWAKAYEVLGSKPSSATAQAFVRASQNLAAEVGGRHGLPDKEAILNAVIGGTELAKLISKTHGYLTDFSPPREAPDQANRHNDTVFDTGRSTGGRTGRATGGAVNLMALSKAAKKRVTQVTEPLLNESDDTVAHALAVAGKNI
jgi:hypothetical protein